METHDDRPYRETSRVDELYDALETAVRGLPEERQDAFLKELDTMLEDELRKAITRSKLTAYALGKKSGVAPEVIARFMSGERDLRLKTASKLADALKLELKRKTPRRKRES